MNPPCFLSMSAAEYHADPCPTPSLSSSVAHTLVNKSPLHAWLEHPKLGGVREEASAGQAHGTLIHALVLGTGLDCVEVIDAQNYRTKAAQESRDAAIEAGKTPILRRELDDARAVAADISEELAERGISLTGQSEQVAMWEEQTEAGPILCRGMLDHVILSADSAIILDLKTRRSAHPKACAAHVLDYGYHVQRAAYVSAVEKIRPDLAGRVDFLWLFVEELPVGSPKRVVLTVARPDGLMREIGEAKWKQACERWAACLASGNWPAYSEDAVMLEAPAWAAKEIES